MDLEAKYLWNVRPKLPSRPAWFDAWPSGEKLAFHVIVLHEWESEPWHRSRPMPRTFTHKFDFLSLGAREYGARHGIWRLLEILERHALKATIMANGLIGELFPESISAAHKRGHEIAAHQWDQAVFPFMFTSEKEEEEAIKRTKEMLEKLTDAEIVGYMSPGPRPTPHTLKIVSSLGFKWISEYIDSDFPYTVDALVNPIIAVPYATPGCIDFDLIGYTLPQRLEHLKYMFDATYSESKRHPMAFCYAVHTHWGGSTGMGHVLDQFLTYVRSHEGIWYANCGQIADFWEQSAIQPR